MGYIYSIRNNINGKMYVGKTIQLNVDSRWRIHKQMDGRCPYLSNALKKYGIENFTFSVICICFDEACVELEKQYILKYNSICPNGYNVHIGGASNYKPDADAKARMAKRMLGNKYGLGNKSNLGLKRNETEKNKMSAAAINKAKVNQYEMDGTFLKEWDSIASAQKSIHKKTGICDVCRGIRPSSGGFLWSYVGDTPGTRRKPSNAMVGRIPKSVQQLTTNGNTVIKTWKSSQEVVETLKLPNVSNRSIRRACTSSILKNLGGFYWRYLQNTTETSE